MKISERKRGTCRAPGCDRAGTARVAPAGVRQQAERPAPQRRASAGREARAGARRGAERARAHPEPQAPFRRGTLSPGRAEPLPASERAAAGRQPEPGEGDRQPDGKSLPLCAVSPRPTLPLPPAQAGNPRRNPLLLTRRGAGPARPLSAQATAGGRACLSRLHLMPPILGTRRRGAKSGGLKERGARRHAGGADCSGRGGLLGGLGAGAADGSAWGCGRPGYAP